MRAPTSQFVIMARTDAAAAEGIDAAIERAVAYVEAGADMIFPEAMKTLDDYRRFKAAVRVPILANLTEFGSTPFFTVDELKDANVDIALYCCGAYRAMNAAALNFYETVKRDGTQKAAVETMQTRADLYDTSAITPTKTNSISFLPQRSNPCEGDEIMSEADNSHRNWRIQAEEIRRAVRRDGGQYRAVHRRQDRQRPALSRLRHSRCRDALASSRRSRICSCTASCRMRPN